MSISKILKYAKLKSELSADELKQAEWLVAMTESDRLAVIELWGMKFKPATKPATKRVIEKCAREGCGFTRRHDVHKLTTDPDYHEFQSPQSSSKSKRAESLAGAIKKTTDKEPRCVVCFEVHDHAEHDVANGGHLFETSVAARANEVLDKYNEDHDNSSERCTATRDGGRICNLLLDHNVHQMKTAMGYHEFVGSETAVGVGGD